MLRFSKKADYGLMAVHYIAFHQHDGVVNTKRIAEDLGIPGGAPGEDPSAPRQGEADRERQRAQGRLRPRPGPGPDPGERGAPRHRGPPRSGELLPDDAVPAARALQHPAAGAGDPERHRAIPGDHDPGDDEYPERAGGRRLGARRNAALRRRRMAVKFPIFMDSNSTTPVDPRVLEAMIPYFTEKFGHPGSRNHSFGWEAEAGMERAREQLARLIGARDPKELVWTSGGTEADNLAIKGVVEMYREKGEPHRHDGDGAARGPRSLPAAREAGARPGDLPAGRRDGRRRSRRAPQGHHRPDRSSSPSCSPTTRSGPSRRSRS